MMIDSDSPSRAGLDASGIASLSLSDAEVAEVVYGYVTAATWTDLLLPCESCEGSGQASDVGAEDLGEGHLPACPDCDGSGGSQETGSDPYEYEPDDLDVPSLARVREMCADFCRAHLADVRSYESVMGPIYDPSKGDECSALERLGHDLYLTSVGHGTGFWDRGLGELGERLSRAAQGYGLDCIMLCSDGTIQAQG